MELLLAELRNAGWQVAVHNDYRLAGEPMTFWLFTHPETGRFIKGEGDGDIEALMICRIAAFPEQYDDDAREVYRRAAR